MIIIRLETIKLRIRSRRLRANLRTSLGLMQCSAEPHVSWPSLTMTWLFALTQVTPELSLFQSKRTIMEKEQASITSLSYRETTSLSSLMRLLGSLRRMEELSPQEWLPTCFQATNATNSNKPHNFLDQSVYGLRTSKYQALLWLAPSATWLQDQWEWLLNLRFKFSIV
jgi:hypothetical protein